MNSIIKWFVIIQSGAAFAIVFLLRFFDYIVENEVTVMFKPLVFIAILVTIILSLIISAAYLFAHKAKKWQSDTNLDQFVYHPATVFTTQRVGY